MYACCLPFSVLPSVSTPNVCLCNLDLLVSRLFCCTCVVCDRLICSEDLQNLGGLFMASVGCNPTGGSLWVCIIWLRVSVVALFGGTMFHKQPKQRRDKTANNSADVVTRRSLLKHAVHIFALETDATFHKQNQTKHERQTS